MNVEIFVLCDAAVADPTGKLSLLGAFDTIFAPQVPMLYPHCAVALRLRFENSEAGDHQVRIVLIDDDGNAVGPQVEGTCHVGRAPGTSSSITNLVIGMNGMPCPKYGEYQFDLVVDGQLKARLPLFVRLPSEDQQKAA